MSRPTATDWTFADPFWVRYIVEIIIFLSYSCFRSRKQHFEIVGDVVETLTVASSSYLRSQTPTFTSITSSSWWTYDTSLADSFVFNKDGQFSQWVQYDNLAQPITRLVRVACIFHSKNARWLNLRLLFIWHCRRPGTCDVAWAHAWEAIDWVSLYMFYDVRTTEIYKYCCWNLGLF